MASTTLYSKTGAELGKVELPEVLFNAEINEALIHQAVIAQLAGRRLGTSNTLTRGAVRGGGAKPYRQKGTGRARQGSRSAPHYKGGGVVFGPHPRHYVVKVNRKARRAALRSALSIHAERETLHVLDASAFDTPSTAKAAELLHTYRGGSVLVALGDDDMVAAKSFCNLARVNVLHVDDVGVADLVRAATLVASQEALDKLTARARKEANV
jgi:large subunit ribosomal protein L4